MPIKRTKSILLGKVRDKICLKHYSLRTEEAYISWVRKYILFHNKEHPSRLGKEHLERFLTYLAVNKKVATSTQNQALSALVSTHKHVETTVIYAHVLKHDEQGVQSPLDSLILP